MKWLLGVYTKRFNTRHTLCGHLFAGRYKALVVEGSGNGYLAHRLRQETTTSLKWIAQGLQMGSWTYVSSLLNQPHKRMRKLRSCCRCVNSD